jgi:GDP-L-fucose synthase
MENAAVKDGLFNIGSGTDVTIRALAEEIMDVVGFRGTLVFDPSKPDGTPRKLMNVDRLKALGWQARLSLREGIQRTYRAYCETLTPSADRAEGVVEMESPHS